MLTIKLSSILSLRKPGASMATRSNPNRQRVDGRKSLLVYMDEALIKELKKFAVDQDCNAYEIVERATRQWLADNLKKKG
jgi:hypothetical protein